MEIKDISLDHIDVSEFNTRKNLADGQADSTIDDLARSIDPDSTYTRTLLISEG